MSWWALVMPAHRYPLDDLAGRRVYGLPPAPPEPAPLPTVAAVLAALVAAGCHGEPWFTVDGLRDALPRCPDPSTCDGLDLGEVRLHVESARGAQEPLHLDDRVELLAMRKPRAGLRAAAVAMAATCPQIVFDDNLQVFVIVHPGDRVEDLAADWPW